MFLIEKNISNLIKLPNYNKKLYLIEDLNLNLLDHRANTKVKDYLDLIFQTFLIPVVNIPTKITQL